MYACLMPSAKGLAPLPRLDRTELEPRGQILELGLHGLAHGAGEIHILMDRVHSQDGCLPVDRAIDFSDQAVVVQDRKREVAPTALRRGLVHLERVFEVEELLRPNPVVDEAVEGRQQRGTPLEVLAQGCGVDAPLAFCALDDGRLAGLADVYRLDRHRGSLLPGDTE